MVSAANINTQSPRPLWLTGFLVVLALLPLPFGSARPWASDLFALLIGIFLALLAFDLYRFPSLWPMGAPWKRISAAAILIAIVVLWAFLQTVGGPFCCHPLWEETKTALGTEVSEAISLTPALFYESLLRMLGYVGCFLLAFFAGRQPAQAFLILKVIAGSAVAYALYGLFIQSTGLNIVLWYDKWAYRDFLTSTFVNKNSYATYAGLGLLACLVLMWRQAKQNLHNKPKQLLFAAWLERFSIKDVIPLLMGFTVFAALVMSGSRGGIASALVGCLALLICLAINRRWRWRIWVAVVVPSLALLIGFTLFGSDIIVDRLGSAQMENDASIRTDAYTLMLNALNDNPWMGFGLGSFDSAFRLYRDNTIQLWFQHAHNDYLELALELGVPAAVLFVSAILLMIGCCLHGVWVRRRQEIFSILAVAASVLVGFHSLVDFSLQIPAVAATYATLLGLGVAQSWSSRTS